MKKFLSALVFFLVLSTIVQADAKSDLQAFVQKWLTTQKDFATAMGLAETSEEARTAAADLVENLNSLQVEAQTLAQKYPHAKGEEYLPVYQQAWSDLGEKKSEIAQLFSFAVRKFAQFVKKDVSLSDEFKTIDQSVKTLKTQI